MFVDFLCVFKKNVCAELPTLLDSTESSRKKTHLQAWNFIFVGKTIFHFAKGTSNGKLQVYGKPLKGHQGKDQAQQRGHDLHEIPGPKRSMFNEQI